MPSHLDVIRDYFAAIERRGSFDGVSRFLSPDVVQREFPNRFAPGGATRGSKELREAAERGRAVIKSQRYEILSSVCEGERVALEVQWIQRFRSGVKNSRVIELHDTNHYVFIVDEALVVREMRKFLLEE
jgi:hypothetical protein